MKHLILAAFALLTTAPAAFAAETTTTVWHEVPIRGGCVVVLAVGGDLPPGEVSWSGVCTPQQPIDGTGVLRIDLTPEFFAGGVMFLDTTFVAGVPHGETTFRVVDGQGVQLRESSATFNMGCLIAENTQPCEPYAPPAAN